MKIGTKVKLLSDDRPDMLGEICGTGSYIHENTLEIIPIYLVRLAEGFYSPKQETFVSVICAHRESMAVVKERD